jgi:hypothetical protein
MDNLHSSTPSTSTTMWTQPQTESQIKYYSKHSPKRKVYGGIQTVLQTAHGFLAFAAWTAIFAWVFQAIPAMAFLAPLLAIATLLAMHILFRTTWDTFWYDRLDDDPNTDSSVFIPIGIMVVLLFAEVRGASMFLESNVRPIEKVDASPIEQQHATTLSSLEQAYKNEKSEVEALIKTKAATATAAIDRQIRRAKADGEKTGALEGQRARILAPIMAEKAERLTKALDRYTAQKESEQGRHEKTLADLDTYNANEVSRYTAELGNIAQYAWAISVALLALIAALGYARVRINVKSGILPQRNYTVLDAHGSIVERFSTAIGDIINRRSLQMAVWLHKLGSPSEALRTFDGTVVAEKGEYNTPTLPAAKPLPQADDEDAVMRVKVFNKLMDASKNGGVQITPEMLESELELAKKLNGTYKTTPLGKPDASPEKTTAPVEATPYPAAEHSDPYKAWANRIIKQVQAYDAAVLNGDTNAAAQYEAYINAPDQPIMTEAFRLGIQFGVLPSYPEIMVWQRHAPGKMVPVSMLSKTAFTDHNEPQESETPQPLTDELLKQYDQMFKQDVQPQFDPEGKVIGVRYRKLNGEWITYPRTQVEAFARQFDVRSTKKPSMATKTSAAKWNYALSLFSKTREELEDLKPILM